jgi:predicted lipid-binding transport protein (Tim44 family)
VLNSRALVAAALLGLALAPASARTVAGALAPSAGMPGAVLLGGAMLARGAVSLPVGLAVAGLGLSVVLAWAHRRRAPTSTPAQEPTPAAAREAAVLAGVRLQFLRLQAAWDRADLAELQALTTPDLYAELRVALAHRGAANRTDVLEVHAKLLGLERVGDDEFAGVEFSGWMREFADRPKAPFRELWMLARPAGAGQPWRLARQQILF